MHVAASKAANDRTAPGLWAQILQTLSLDAGRTLNRTVCMARAAAEVDELDFDQDLTGAGCLRFQATAAVLPGAVWWDLSCMPGAVVLLLTAVLVDTARSTQEGSDWLSVLLIAPSLSAASACRAAVQSPACTCTHGRKGDAKCSHPVGTAQCSDRARDNLSCWQQSCVAHSCADSMP
jgi:hypothetical protein